MYWRDKVYPLSGSFASFHDFWTKSLQDGVFEQKARGARYVKCNLDNVTRVAENTGIVQDDSFELILYENVSIGNGKQANNPWLQELPDPVSKVCWDNYAAVSPALANELGLSDGSLIVINGTFTLPVIVQPGQEYKTISVALGFGHRNAGMVADGVGVDMYPMVTSKDQNRIYTITNVKIKAGTGNYPLAMTQMHHSMEGREIIRETTFADYYRNPASGNEKHGEVEKNHVSLYSKKEYKGHHWGMAIDLNSCVGCSACVIACSVENNVPVVGKQQVQRAREMHWIRIDRYYSGNPENPEVIRQPVMCQHCDNAPCENVCPVAATSHSDEGLNQMVYNRCIGTRYCNNNCPYKVRRFNFFDYTKADAISFYTKDATGMTSDLKRMVLNPDGTVRAKGVIEKCSMCVQRVQEKKLDAKLEKRPLKDGEIKPACAQACPADAIVFGDLNDPGSRVSKMFKEKRNYHLLEELHTLPSVGYLTKVRNKLT
jgi:molybdopterin-containing oxidoreductase family iron-sulfur binding subunit